MKGISLHLILYAAFYAAPPSAKGATHKLGEGVRLHAQVFYDDSFRNSSTERNDTFMRDHFNKIFASVQAYINKMQLMINISVANVTHNESLVVRDESGTDPLKIQPWKTLEKLREYAQDLNNSNDSIHYLFASREFYENETQTDDLHTNDTFCTGDASATIVHTVAFNYEFYKTATKMTLLTKCPKYSLKRNRREAGRRRKRGV
uniref:28 kDa Metastriate family member n=1 Tax=Rhipicephalus zambeziensis TaxID=60191 RepID=A0A224YBN2_9ACAR